MKKMLALGLCLALSLLLVRPGHTEGLKLNLISGPVTGGWYVGMGVVGKAISSEYPDVAITMLPGAASTNPIRVSRGLADLGIMQVALGTAAREGMAPFKSKVGNLCSLVSWGDLSPLSFVIREDTGITSLDDIAARKAPLRIAVGNRGGGGDVYGAWVLGEYGITWDKIKEWGGAVYFNSYDDMTNMAKDGQVDMIIWLGRGESWFLSEITKDIKMRWLSIKPEVVAKVTEKYGMVPAVVPGKLYSGRVGGEDIPSVAEVTGLIVRQDMDEDTVYRITKAICQRREDIIKGFPTWETFTLETATQNLPFPLHPGAEKYYRETGALKQ